MRIQKLPGMILRIRRAMRSDAATTVSRASHTVGWYVSTMPRRARAETAPPPPKGK